MDEDVEGQLADKARVLADAIEAAIGPWLIGAVRRVGAAQQLTDGDRLILAAEAAAERARAAVMPRIRDLLARDIDEQDTTPLALLREAVGPATAVLRDLGATPVDRDEFAARAFPDDLYDLTPASFEDLAPELATPGLEWGAAKAYVHLRRRRGEDAG